MIMIIRIMMQTSALLSLSHRHPWLVRQPKTMIEKTLRKNGMGLDTENIDTYHRT